MAKLVHVEWKFKPRKPTQTVFPQTNSHIWARFKTNLESKAAFLCREMLNPPHPPIICPRLQTPGGGIRLSESHARSIRAAASLQLCCIIKKMERKKQLINSVRPLPPIALGNLLRSPRSVCPQIPARSPNFEW